MFDELVNQVKAQLYDRARSPLFGAFLIAWVSWNFLTVLLLFSNDSIAIKTKTFVKLYPTNWSYVCNGILFPLLSSAAFILIYPYLAKIAFWHWNNQHIKIKKIQQKQEDETPATQEEINVLRKNSLGQQIELQKQIRELSNANNEFKSRELEILTQTEKHKSELSDCQKTVENSLKSLENLSNTNKSLEDTIVKMTQEKELAAKNVPTELKKSKGYEYKSNFIKSFSLLNLGVNKTTYKKLLADVDNYAEQYGYTNDILKVIFELVLNDGRLHRTELTQLLPNNSEIENDDLINLLQDKQLASSSGSEILLSPNGKRIVVSSGITKLAKIINPADF